MRLPVTVLDRWFPALGTWAFKLIRPTLRYQIENDEPLRAHHESGRPLIVAGFHGRILLGVLPLAPYEPAIVVSWSRDGERIGAIVDRLGWRPVRGSSSRGGVRALLGLVRAIKDGGIAGHVLDGPRGPAGVIKPGVMLLAQRAHAPILPVYLTARPALTVPSWDRMQLPLPFARVRMRFDEPMYVPIELDSNAVEGLRLTLEKRMAQGQAELDAES